MKQPISLCMIVKNNEFELERCLNSCADLFMEIVIVDTGSTDKTREIARKYTDKIFDFEWVDDFALARNFSYSKATQPWIMYLDSDDIMIDADKEKLRRLDLVNTKFDMFLMRYIYSHFSDGKPELTLVRERLVRRSLNLQWVGRVHETIPVITNRCITDIEIHHYKKGPSSERNIRILKQMVAKDGHNTRNLYYLAKELWDFGHIQEAKPYYERFVDSPNGHYEDKLYAYERLAELALTENKDDLFKDYIYKSLRIEERRHEPYFYLAKYYESKKMYLNAIHFYTVCINTKRNPDLMQSFLPHFIYDSYLQLCVCHNAIGQVKEALSITEKYLELMPSDSRANHNLKLLKEFLSTKKDGQSKKLNLGCGAKRIEGYVNCDIYPAKGVDEVFDIKEIPYKDNSISEISSEHAIEHLSFADAKQALQEWFRVLEPNGVLELYLPDLEMCCWNYLKADNSKSVNYIPERDWYRYTMFGIQKDANGSIAKHQFHLSGYSKMEMEELLESIGFIIEVIENY